MPPLQAFLLIYAMKLQRKQPGNSLKNIKRLITALRAKNGELFLKLFNFLLFQTLKNCSVATYGFRSNAFVMGVNIFIKFTLEISNE